MVFLLARYYSMEEFGVWSTITSTAAIIVNGDFGIVNALRNKISNLIHQKNGNNQAKEYFFSSFIYLLFLSLILVLGLFVLYHYLNFNALFKTDNIVLTTQGSTILLWIQIIFLLSIPFSIGSPLFYCYYEALHASIVIIIQNIVQVLILATQCYYHATIVQISITYFILNFIFTVIGSLLFIYRRKWFSFHFELNKSFKQFRELFRVGLGFLGLQLTNSFLMNASVLLSSAFLNVTLAGQISLLQKLYLVPSSLYQSLLNPLWGSYAEAVTKNDFTWCRQIYNKSIKYTGYIFILATIIIVFFANNLLSLITDKSINLTITSILLFSIGTLFTILYQTSQTFLNAVGLVSTRFFSGFIFSILLIAISNSKLISFNLNAMLWLILLIWIGMFVISDLTTRVFMKNQ